MPRSRTCSTDISTCLWQVVKTSMHFDFNRQGGRKRKQLVWAIAIAAALYVAPARGAGPIKVMLLDGESGGAYHAWKITTPVLKKELEETGLFQVEVVTAPAQGADFSAFKPDFSA